MKKTANKTLLSASIITGLFSLSACTPEQKPTELASAQSENGSHFSDIESTLEFCSAGLDYATKQLARFRQTYTDPSQIPRSFNDGKVRLAEPKDWTSGFVAGSFWYIFEHTQDPTWLASAKEWTHALEDQQFNLGTHDLGFMIFNSYGNGLRLTDNKDYIPIIVQTADSLMTRYDPVVGATRSWDFGDWEFPVIIDNMMNLELLFEASKHTGNESYADAAISHATLTMNNHFRPDFSSYHVVDYSTTTAEAIHKQTYQGINDDSDWARGQAWGAYGYTTMYRYTNNEAFLQQAIDITEFILNHPNMPADLVPYFDFDAPDLEDVPNYRDSSAASLLASSLLELATYVEADDATRYQQAALTMLRNLSKSEYLAKGDENGNFILKQATGHYPHNYEISGALNYADYYYVEALTRCKGL
jgi:rhamnogalacturonyl hydrolase YesR